MAVVALEDAGANTPRVMPSAHFGSQFDIGALGAQVVSTRNNGRFVRLSGSSQAAPQVAAVASLLFATTRNLLPVEVKNA
jgi:subtilisin family serine protease